MRRNDRRRAVEAKRALPEFVEFDLPPRETPTEYAQRRAAENDRQALLTQIHMQNLLEPRR